MAQAAATLRRSEYTAFLIKWLDENMQDQKQFVDRHASWHAQNEFALAQTLMAIGQLASDSDSLMEIVRMARIEEKLQAILHTMNRDLSDSHTPILTALLWSIRALNFKDIFSESNGSLAEFEEKALA